MHTAYILHTIISCALAQVGDAVGSSVDMMATTTTNSEMSSSSISHKNRSQRRKSRHNNALVDDAAPWLSAPINLGTDWTPLGVPTTTVAAVASPSSYAEGLFPHQNVLNSPEPVTTKSSSPSRGSAVSRARWSTTVPVTTTTTAQSVRHRSKKSHSHSTTRPEPTPNESRANRSGTTTLGSSDSDKEQRPPLIIAEKGSLFRTKSEKGGVQSRDPSPARQERGQTSSVRQGSGATGRLGHNNNEPSHDTAILQTKRSPP
jgi:hypothetical protein